jgi:hypothetical protein
VLHHAIVDRGCCHARAISGTVIQQSTTTAKTTVKAGRNNGIYPLELLTKGGGVGITSIQ